MSNPRLGTQPLSPARVGALLGLGAAALFGVSTPLSKRLLETTPPQVLAGLLYLGAGLSLSGQLLVRTTRPEARLRRADAPILAAIALFGGVLGPLLLLLGLLRVPGIVGSLLLNLEAPITMILAVAFFREHLGARALLAAGLITLGAALLQLRSGDLAADAPGVAFIALACLCWAIDNNLTQRISLRDPVAVVRAKSLAAGAFNLGLAALMGQKMPSPSGVALSLALGAVSYGVSIVLHTYALRFVGAARQAAYFATAPFFGASISILVLGERPGAFDLASVALMGLGVVLLLGEHHRHLHEHAPLVHEHVHEHDEHHQHAHEPGTSSAAPHSHEHQHDALTHDHPHVSDLHHRHRH